MTCRMTLAYKCLLKWSETSLRWREKTSRHVFNGRMFRIETPSITGTQYCSLTNQDFVWTSLIDESVYGDRLLSVSYQDSWLIMTVCRGLSHGVGWYYHARKFEPVCHSKAHTDRCTITLPIHRCYRPRFHFDGRQFTSRQGMCHQQIPADSNN